MPPGDGASFAAMAHPPQAGLPEITSRQREVVKLIAAGCSNEEVAEQLGITPRTVKAHCDVLRQKLGVARRRQIPVAYRTLTGEDPLARDLGPTTVGLRRTTLQARASPMGFWFSGKRQGKGSGGNGGRIRERPYPR